MNPFVLTKFADEDMDGIIEFVQGLPRGPAIRLGRDFQQILESIASQPRLGQVDAPFSDLFGVELRRRVCNGYLIFYALNRDIPQIVAILHGKRDINKIMRKRSQ